MSGPSSQKYPTSPELFLCPSCQKSKGQGQTARPQETQKSSASDHPQGMLEKDDCQSPSKNVKHRRNYSAKRQTRDPANTVPRGATVRYSRSNTNQQPSRNDDGKICWGTTKQPDYAHDVCEKFWGSMFSHTLQGKQFSAKRSTPLNKTIAEIVYKIAGIG